MADTADLGGFLERAVMEALWEAPEPLRIRQLVERLNADATRPLAYSTVQTVADRLADKGLVERVRDRPAFHYAPVQTREDYVARLMIQLLSGASEHGAILTTFARILEAEDAHVLLKALHSRPGEHGTE